MRPGLRTLFATIALCASCSVELAALQSLDAGAGGNVGSPDGSLGGAGSGGNGNAGSGGGAGDASVSDAGDASDASAPDAPTGVVLCSVDFEVSKCFEFYNLYTSGNAHCGPDGALSGSISGTLEGGNSTSIIKDSCGSAPPDLWFELVYRRDSNGIVTFKVGELGIFGNGGAQVKVGDGSSNALLECPDGKDMNQFLPSALNTPYVITLHITQSGQVELWHRQKSPLVPRGAPQATLNCPNPKTVAWAATGAAFTTIDDIRVASAPGSLIYK